MSIKRTLSTAFPSGGPTLGEAACAAFERDISAFVDRELPTDAAARLVEHLDACGPCRAFLDDLQGLVAVHRDVEAELGERGERAEEALVDRLVGKHRLFADITRRLLADKRGELIRLFYELGKAYVLAGNRQRTAIVTRQPMGIRRAMDQGRRLVDEAEGLVAETPSEVREQHAASGDLFRRSRRMFRGSRAGAGALANGRRYLEEALALRPDFAEARLYLGFHHMLVRRTDRARIEFEKVRATSSDPVHRMMAVEWLGAVHLWEGHYEQAIECFERALAERPELLGARINLAMSCARVGRSERAIEQFREIVSSFPNRVERVRQLVNRQSWFTGFLRDDGAVHDELCRAVPALFGSGATRGVR